MYLVCGILMGSATGAVIGNIMAGQPNSLIFMACLLAGALWGTVGTVAEIKWGTFFDKA